MGEGSTSGGWRLRDSKWVDWGVNGRAGGASWSWASRAVVRSLGPEDMRIVEMSCESGRWAKVARLESGVRGTMMSCQLGRETRGTVLEAASEVGLALSSAASVWSSVGAAREHRIFLLCESSSWPVRGKLAENPRSRPIVRPRSLIVRPRSQSLGDATRTSPRSS